MLVVITIIVMFAYTLLQTCMCCLINAVDTNPGVLECDGSLVPLTHDMDHEYEARDQSRASQLSVQGRLRSHSTFWLQELEPSPFVREVIEHGYRIPFIWLPDPVFYRNHRSAFEHAQFVEEAIKELVAAQCVVQCAEYPVVCSPLSVVVSGTGKKRLVLDLRYVNQFILMKKFKYEGLNVVPQCVVRVISLLPST